LYRKVNQIKYFGESLETLAEGTYETGFYKVMFNASALPSDAYISRVGSNHRVQFKKMIFVKYELSNLSTV
jgi:hypothetical protein